MNKVLAFLNSHVALIVGVAVAAMLFGAGLALGKESGRKEAQKAAIQTLRIAQDSLHVALVEVEVTNAQLANSQKAVAGMERKAAVAERAIAAISARIPALQARYDSLSRVTLDTALSNACGCLIMAEREITDSLRSIVTVKDSEISQQKEDLAKVQKTLSDLARSARAVDTAANKVVSLIRPPLYIRILPKPGVGIAIGVDRNGKPSVLAGLLLGWPR